MKTSRAFRIFMMGLDLIVMFFLRLFKKFTRLRTFDHHIGTRVVNNTEETSPEKMGIVSKLEVDGQETDSYERKDPVYVSDASYSEYEGIVTFRGNHRRNGYSYGRMSSEKNHLNIDWTVDTGRLQKGYGKGFWTGSGWTGQPLIVRWTEDQKKRMNIYPTKKEEDLTEVIYSTMDGKVYFLDIEDGSFTRDVIDVGLPFKGSGAIHPSLPLLHLGPGDSGPKKEDYARAYIYNLENQKKLFEYGGKDPFSIRSFCGFDSSPLFFNDYIFEPSENGLIYSFKLNAHYEDDELTIAPDEFVKLQYHTYRSSEKKYWLGMEDSPVVWENYLYIADNGGTLLCIDMNTMKIIWAQDVVDDTNGSPVLSIEEGHPYLYIGTSLHWSPSRYLRLGYCPFFKIDALNGEYVWIRDYYCNTIAGISGGVQSSPILGENDIKDLIIFPVARTPSVMDGKLVALDIHTGKEIWSTHMKNYAWSSPVVSYDEAGNSLIVQCDSGGMMHLIRGVDGKIIDSLSLGANIEATPAMMGDRIVVGTRGQKIYGVSIR